MFFFFFFFHDEINAVDISDDGAHKNEECLLRIFSHTPLTTLLADSAWTSGGGQPIKLIISSSALDYFLLAAGIWVLAYYQKGMVDNYH